jgi:hypothetical protein
MKSFIFATFAWLALAITGFARIGEDPKQIEARYGQAGKDLGEHGDVHEVGYMSGGFLILVSYVSGISQREGFTNPDHAPLTPEAVQQILAMSAADGTKWVEKAGEGGDKTWARSDGKAVAIFPAMGKFIFVQDINFVQPKQ